MFLLKAKEVLLGSDIFSFCVFVCSVTLVIYIIGLHIDNLSKRD